VTEARTPLSQSQYVQAATDFVDEHGLAALTMRALGARLGVDATAIYRHFPTKEALLDAILDNLLAPLVATPVPDGADPREALWEMLHQVWSEFQRHPNLPGAFATATGAFPNGLEYTRRIIGLLRALGLSGPDLVEGYQLLESYVIGSNIMNTGGNPSTWEIRQARYRFLGEPEFTTAASDPERVREVAHRAFLNGLELIFAELERRAIRA